MLHRSVTQNFFQIPDILRELNTSSYFILNQLFSVFPKHHLSQVYIHTTPVSVNKGDYICEPEKAVPVTLYFNNYYSYHAALLVFSNDVNLRAAWDNKTLGLLVTKPLIDQFKNPDTFRCLQDNILAKIKRHYLEQSAANKIPANVGTKRI